MVVTGSMHKAVLPQDGKPVSMCWYASPACVFHSCSRAGNHPMGIFWNVGVAPQEQASAEVMIPSCDILLWACPSISLCVGGFPTTKATQIVYRSSSLQSIATNHPQAWKGPCKQTGLSVPTHMQRGMKREYVKTAEAFWWGMLECGSCGQWQDHPDVSLSCALHSRLGHCCDSR